MGLIINPANDIIKMSSLNKGLVGHWPLDQESLQSATTFADKTPNENVGTKYGSVLKFDGSDDNVNCGSDASLDTAWNTLTVSAWIKADDITPANTNAIISKGSSYGDNNFNFRLSVNGKVEFWYSSSSVVAESATVIDSGWHFVTAVLNGTDVTVYLDAVAGTTLTTTVAGTTSGSNVYIGSWNIDATWWWDGSIGDARIYSRALTPAEILTMYQGGVVDDTDLEAHYKMDDKSGTTLTDHSANTNTGTLTNFADTTAGYGNTHDSGWVTDDTPNVFALDKMGH